MASSRILITLTAFAIAVSACSSAADGSTSVTRALLPPAEAAPPATTTTTTTLVTLSPMQSDQLARTQIRSVLAAAEEIYSETGTYNATLETVSALAGNVAVVSLEEAALYDAVVYEAFDQRLTLHHQSGSGRWFCVDITDQGTDHGIGDTFDQALEDCTDGVRATGWGDVFSPTGPDQAAITALLRTTFEALQAGNTAGLHRVFDVHRTCDASELETVWPTGLQLFADEELALEAVAISGDAATATVSLGTLTDPEWPLVKREDGWLNAADPCELLEPLAIEVTNAAARETLQAGLFAVRSLYVNQTSFAFSPSSLANIDADLHLVAPAELTFGTIAYRGSSTEGLLITRAGPEVFYCAVESSSAVTVYGEGSTVDEVNTAGRCRAHATS